MKIEPNENKVLFNNGKTVKEIHPFWLRERVSEDEYLDKGTQQRLFDPSTMNGEIIIKKAQINLIVNKDLRLDRLGKRRKEQELKRRQKLWDKVSKLYLLGDFYGVLDESKPLYSYPSHKAMAHLLSGLSAKKFQDYSLAEKHLKLAIHNKVKSPQAYFSLGKVLFAQDKLDESFNNFKASLKNEYLLSVFPV